jgi:hypothetical protein
MTSALSMSADICTFIQQHRSRIQSSGELGLLDCGFQHTHKRITHYNRSLSTYCSCWFGFRWLLMTSQSLADVSSICLYPHLVGRCTQTRMGCVPPAAASCAPCCCRHQRTPPAAGSASRSSSTFARTSATTGQLLQGTALQAVHSGCHDASDMLIAPMASCC